MNFHRTNAAQLARELQDWLDAHVSDDHGPPDCRRCARPLLNHTVSLSVHVAEMSGCGGFGTVLPCHIPYCPACDGERPPSSGCVHLAYDIVRELAFARGNLRLPEWLPRQARQPWRN